MSWNRWEIWVTAAALFSVFVRPWLIGFCGEAWRDWRSRGVRRGPELARDPEPVAVVPLESPPQSIQSTPPPKRQRPPKEEGDPQRRGVARRLARAMDRALSLIEQAEQFGGESSGTWHGDGLQNLRECDFFLFDDVIDELNPGQQWLVDDPVEYARTFWPIDVALANYRGTALNLIRVATVEPAQVRSMVKIVPPKMLVITSGMIEGGRLDAQNNIVGLVGGKWIDISRHELRTAGRGVTLMQHNDSQWAREAQQTVEIAFATLLTARYQWHVAFGFGEKGPRILLPTAPRGALHLFKNRAVEPGKTRRDALRHWVAEHYRNKKDDADFVAYVRNHLRGNTRFSWNGAQAELLVSQSDLETNEFFRLQAAEWRSRRKHNRIRLKGKVK